jgi:transposase
MTQTPRNVRPYNQNQMDLFPPSVRNLIADDHMGHVSINGTKIKANASDKRTYDSRRIDREIACWLAQSETTDQKEDHQYGKDKTGDELPEGIRDQQQRLQRLEELKAQLEHSGKEKINMTDPDAVFMKTGSGIKTAFNGQAAIDSAQQVIIAADVTSEAADAMSSARGVSMMFPSLYLGYT